MINREEKVEYRDQNGNLLNEEQIQKLKEDGNVKFQTKYETRTRMVDANGSEIPMPSGWAPQHPDVQGQNPDTKGVPEGDGKSVPAEAPVSSGRSVDDQEQKQPKPASDVNEATA